MKIRFKVGTTGILNGKVMLFDLNGNVADFTNSNWKTFASDAGTDTIDAGEVGVTGMYEVEIPATFVDQWVEAVFFTGSKTSLAKAFCSRPNLANVSLSQESMLYRAAGRLGGATPTRDATTGTKTFKDADGNTVYTETPTSTAATRVFP